MFQRRGDKLFCVIHPDVEITRGPIKTHRGWKLGETCTACDELVEQLKKTKSTEDRFKK